MAGNRLLIGNRAVTRELPGNVPIPPKAARIDARQSQWRAAATSGVPHPRPGTSARSRKR
ncbi:hypothetical protein BV25DRAFT_1829079 [Artomyces pyxidatus]|uniref:Uncharacterized protein n=1 Tax=Artomyces pyxidatus TaxID=48021 RepID=A0ACB8STL3_9AGAM|nr:hypothetical protein BV25DRAFT_1829079 [Artomyces pyxidatus]